MHILFVFSPLFFSLAAGAATVSSIGGVSHYDLTGTAKAFGGLAQQCSGQLVACNDSPITDATLVSVYITSETAGNLIVTKQNEINDLDLLTNVSNEVAQLTWSEICKASSQAVPCSAITTSANVVLRFWIDTNANEAGDNGEDYVDVSFEAINPGLGYDTYANPSTDGIGHFYPYPGDEKVFLDQLLLSESSTFPTLGYGSVIEFVRVYYATNLTRAMPTLALGYVDLEVSEDGSGLTDDQIGGLSNGTVYAFRVAMLDEAKNVVQFYPDDDDDVDCNVDLTPATKAACAFAAIPDEVVGLLSDDFNCFVASAAYGSSLEPKLNTFRTFRNRVLLTREWGKKFVTWYYKAGPYAARFIHDKPMLRSLTRAALWPLYAFSSISLKWGLWAAFGVFFISLSTLILLPFYGVKRWSARA